MKKHKNPICTVSVAAGKMKMFFQQPVRRVSDLQNVGICRISMPAIARHYLIKY